MKVWFLKIHRWVALTFALPLVLVLGSALVLSFEPWLIERAIQPGSLSAAKVQELLGRHDAGARARAIVLRSYDGTLTIGAGRGEGTVVDVATGEARSGPSTLAEVLTIARRMHEKLLFDAGWLVIGATVAMLILALLGVLMGRPRLGNTLSGWHKAFAWCLLPLVVLSPLTGLFMAAGLTFSEPPTIPRAPGVMPATLADAVRIVGESHDLSALVWLRPRGNRMLARVVENGEFRVYVVAQTGTSAQPRNWPRLWHEGNFAGARSSLMNVVATSGMIGLLATGPWLWLRRRRALRHVRRAQAPGTTMPGTT